MNLCRPSSEAFTKCFFPIVVAHALLIAGCGGSPTAEGGADAQADSNAEGESLDDVYAQVEGMTGNERREKLIELATDECDQPIDFYTSINSTASEPLLDRFTEETGIPAQLYRAANQDILHRVLQEEKANAADVADVIANNDLEQSVFARDGILAPLETPATEDDPVVHDTWAGMELYVYVAAWNTDNLSSSEAPTSWEAVFETDGLAYQFGDFNWFATLVNDWYVAEQGMTEREAVDMIKDAVREGSQSVDGHTLGAQLLTAGEYSVASSLYHNTVSSMAKEGAPIAWEPIVEPLIVRSTGVGIHHRTPCPASSLLLTEFMLTDAQEMLPEFERTPALEGVQGGFPEKYDTMPINLDLLLDDRDKWLALHDEVTGAVGGEPLVEN